MTERASPTYRTRPDDLSPALKRLAVGGAAGLTLLSAIGTAFSPVLLIESPLLLIALSPEYRHLLLVAGRADFEAVIAVGTARRLLSMLSTYGLAAVYGFTVVRYLERRYPRVGSIVRFIESLFSRVGLPMLVLLPGYTLTAVAGAARAPFRPFLIATFIGQLIQMTIITLFGEAIQTWTDPIVAFLRAHLIESTALCVLLVIIQQLWSRRRPPLGAED